MENQFAKLFTYPTGQLLVIIEDDEHGLYKQVVVRTDRDDNSLITKRQPEDDSAAWESFNSYDDTKAEMVFNGMQDFMNTGGRVVGKEEQP